MRKLSRLKTHEKCPGEFVCTTDIIRGVIAQRAGETLETYCHSNPGGCKLYYTKPGTIPREFLGAIEAASAYRQDELIHRPPSDDSPGWEIEAYKMYERCRSLAEQEYIEERQNNKDGKSKVEEAMQGNSNAFKFDNPVE